MLFIQKPYWNSQITHYSSSTMVCPLEKINTAASQRTAVALVAFQTALSLSVYNFNENIELKIVSFFIYIYFLVVLISSLQHINLMCCTPTGSHISVGTPIALNRFSGLQVAVCQSAQHRAFLWGFSNVPPTLGSHCSGARKRAQSIYSML